MVDLDGARNGRIENLAILEQIVKETGAHVQFGGGVRDEFAINAAARGAVIVGTGLGWNWFEAVVPSEYARRIALEVLN